MRRLLKGLAAAILLVGVLSAVFQRHWLSRSQKAIAAAPPAPVTVALAQSRSVPIILRGLGTVVAYNAVAIRARVEGNIAKVNFHEGQYVHKGDVLFELDPRPYQAALDQAKALLARDEAALANAQVDLQRYSALLKRSFAPEQQYATQKALVAQDQANVKNDKAQIEAAKLNLDFATLRSPIDGITGIRLVDIGNLIPANSTETLVNVTQIKPIYVQFTLPEGDIAEVRHALAKDKLKVLGFDSTDQHEIAMGTLDLINNSVDQTTGMISARAIFANKDLALWPGQFVNAHLVLETVRNGITIPQVAVQAGPRGRYVYVVKADSTVEMRPVKVRQIEDNLALLSSGVKAGEKVVALGQSRLEPGAKVAIVSQQSVTALARAALTQTELTPSSAADRGRSAR